MAVANLHCNRYGPETISGARPFVRAGMGHGANMADNAKKTAEAISSGAIRARRAMVAAPKSQDEGVVLGAEDFAQLQECMTQNRTPNAVMISAMELHRQLTSRR
jgi:hypothetical protein